MAFIAKPIYWLYFAFKILNFSFVEGSEWVINKFEGNWKKIIGPAKEMIETTYLENIKFVKS